MTAAGEVGLIAARAASEEFQSASSAAISAIRDSGVTWA